MTITIPVDVSAIVDGENIDAADITTPINDLKVAVEDTLNGEQPFEQVNLGPSSEVTISSGTITVTGSNHRIDTESNSASDDLDTINGGTEGDIVWLRLENVARTVRLRHNTGNIYLSSLSNHTLASQHEEFPLIFTGTKWVDWPQARRIDGLTTIVPFTSLGTGPNSITGIPNIYTELHLVMAVKLTSGANIILTLNNATGGGQYAYSFNLLGSSSVSTSQNLSANDIRVSVSPSTDPGWSYYHLTLLRPNDAGTRIFHLQGFNPKPGPETIVGGGWWLDSGATGAITRIDLTNTSVFSGSAWMLYGIV